MNLKHYNYFIANNFQEYYFCSEGPRGNIEKVVLYDKISEKPEIYNLAFGDFDTVSRTINDLTVSNNGDRDVILATVAHTVNNFSDHFKKPLIFLKGSTPSRTRLYQMGIGGIWTQAQAYYEILGYREEDWHPFQKNLNFESFYVKKK